MARNKGASGERKKGIQGSSWGWFFQGRRESWVTGEFMARNKGGFGGSSKEEGNHGLQGSSW